MSASRARKIMIAAIAISLLLHLILAGYIPWPFNRPSEETQIVKVRQITIARIVPHTPPPPTPAPTPLATAAPKATVVPPSLTKHGNTGRHLPLVVAPATTKTPAPIATAAPTAAASAAAKPCLFHDISPAVAATADPASFSIPPEVRASKATGTAQIQVQIDPQGAVTNATVAQSSGNSGLDAVAMQMAKSATYSPALVKCKPIASNYTYSVHFVAW